MSQRNASRTNKPDKYWSVVGECLRRFHHRSAADVKQLVSQMRKKLEQSSPEASRELFFHAEPFDVACDLADHQIELKDQRLVEYIELRDGMLSPRSAAQQKKGA